MKKIVIIVLVIFIFLGILFFLIKKFAVPNSIHNLANKNEFNLRIDGLNNGDELGMGSVAVADIDGNGKPDLIIGAVESSNRGREKNGSIYIIYDRLFSSLMSKGNIINLGKRNNYSIRLDGPMTNSNSQNVDLGSFGGLKTADIDGDGKPDLMISCGYCNYGGPSSGSVFIIYNKKLKNLSLDHENSADLANSSNYSLRFDGQKNTLLGGNFIGSADFDGDGKDDIIISGYNNKGSVYIINNNLFRNHKDSSIPINLSDSNNYTFKFFGANASANIGNYDSVAIGDIDGDGKPDLLMGAYQEGFNNLPLSGSIYIVFNSLIKSFSKKDIDLSNIQNFSLRIDGASSLDKLGRGQIILADFDNDGKLDIAAPAWHTSYGLAQSGSVYIFLNTLINQSIGNGTKLLWLKKSTSYNLRFDGAYDGTQSLDSPHGGLLGDMTVNAADVTGNSKISLIIGGPTMGYGDGDQTGIIYSINNSILNRFTGTGHHLPLTDKNNYSSLYYGPNRSHLQAMLPIPAAIDLNGDGRNDWILSAHFYDRSRPGSVYIIYNH